MVYDICFDISAILFLSIAMVSTARLYAQPTLKHKRFSRVARILVIALILDVFSAFSISYSAHIPVKINMVINGLDFVAISLFVYSYAIYIEAYIREDELGRKFRTFNKALFIAYVILHAVNVFGGFLFYFNENLQYTRGRMFLVLYVVPSYFFTYSVLIMLMNRKCFERRQFLAAMSLVPFAFVAAVLQYSVLSHYLMILFAYALGAVVVFFNMDTPDYGKLEAALREADEANKAKGDFLANMSHEIRTPMNAIVGMCELALREEEISPSIQDYCINIQNAGRSLLSIINDILDFSKIESGKVELIEDEFNISSTINDVINMAMTRKGNKKLELIVHVDPEIPKGLIGDEMRIRQVIVNMVTNAIKYTNEGCVVIRVSQKRYEYGINLSVSVRDTGIGITEENLEKLFTSFQQVDTKKNRSVEGTGLGLAISKRLVRQMGGFINVSSRYGQGSEFKFVIPLKVVNNEGFVKVKNATSIHAIGFFDVKKFDKGIIGEEYYKIVEELREELHTDIRMAASLEELKETVKNGNYTHVFAGREEYLVEKTFFTEVSHKLTVVLLQDRFNAISVPKNIKCIYKPFYVMSVAAVFNNENILTNFRHKRSYTDDFIAPEARVLVVDDNEINLKVAIGLMKPYRMQVETAISAREAIAAIESGNFDIVFMDHMMPEIDGVEAAQMIREKEGDYYKKLPIIALTANAVNGVKDIFLEAGLNDFIAKPIEISALNRILKTWLPESLQEKNYIEGNDKETESMVRKILNEEESDFFSMKTGLRYTGGNLEDYYEILAEYIGKGMEKMEQIEKFYQNQMWKDYVIHVHALKSSSLSIGALKLSKIAAELENAGKTGDYDKIHAENAVLIGLYKEALATGKEKLESWKSKKAAVYDCGKVDVDTDIDINKNGKVPSEIEAEELQIFIERIEAAVERFDNDEIIQACDELAGHSFGGISLVDKMRPVRELAKDFECEEAGRKAGQIFAELMDDDGA